MLLRVLLLFLPSFQCKWIVSESVRDLSIHLCSHERERHAHSFGLLHFSPETVQWCVTATTNKGPSQQSEDFARSTKSSSVISFSWAPLNSPLSCSIKFNGYRSTYRLSPDFGAYSSCQSHLSKHVHGLSHSLHGDKHKRKRKRREEDEECPIINFPQSYNEFSSCQLMADTWYRLDARSAIFSEEFVNGSYSPRWSNMSSHFLFHTNLELERNGTADQWMARVLSIDAVNRDCNWALVHVTVAKEWRDKQYVTIVYRVHSGHSWLVRNITQHSVSSWDVFPLPFDRKYEEHQVCAHLRHESAKRGRVCKIFSLPKNCTRNASGTVLTYANMIIIAIVVALFL